MMASEICLEASEEGDELALGMKYFFGWDTIKDFELSYLIFQEILEKDQFFSKDPSFYALNFIAYMNQVGYGVEKNIEHSILLYDQLIELNKNILIPLNLMQQKEIQSNFEISFLFY
jgi:hypothetical protein